MAQPADSPVSFESGHQDLIHDVEMDFYGRTLATASSDHTIRIHEITNNGNKVIAVLQGHTGPVWKVSWAHPKHGKLLASASYDRKVIIWQSSQSHRNWQKIHIDDDYKASVNTVQFSKSNFLELLSGSSDGTISTYIPQRNNKWVKSTFLAHNGGVNAVSWAPYNDFIESKKMENSDGSSNIRSKAKKRFASCGCDNVVKIWNYNFDGDKYDCVATLKGHHNWVRDVAWSPIAASSAKSIIASASEDKCVIIWKEKQNGQWIAMKPIQFESKVWSVSWSEMGNILAVSFAENSVQLFKQSNDGTWQNVSKINN